MVDIRTVIVQPVDSDGDESEMLREREKTPMPISEDSESDWNEPLESSKRGMLGLVYAIVLYIHARVPVHVLP